MVYRIRVLRNFANFKKSDVYDFKDQGNYCLERDTRSRSFIEDQCVFKDAIFNNDSYVRNGVCVCDNAQVHCMFSVSSFAVVEDKAQACGSIEICRISHLSQKIKIIRSSKRIGTAYIYSGTEIYDSAQFFVNSQIYGNALVGSSVKVREKAKVECNPQSCECEDLRNDEGIYIYCCIFHAAKEASNNNARRACVAYLPP
ncbi:hypothetical protein [Bartonella senegalensis]|uniref:hypothetical protein n=1 Tax=Bartonella senegalensis TaxID=1468418 RepID=UPI00031BF243|nr:hypothetical protein [Bartonella senegalensis]